MRANPPRLTNSSGRPAHSTALLQAEARLVEEVGGHLVAEVPRVEAGRPGLHLPLVDASRLIDEGGQQSRLVVAAAPEREGQAVVATEPLGQAPQLGDRHAEGVVDPDAVARHAGAILVAALRGELGEDRRHALLNVSGCRRGRPCPLPRSLPCSRLRAASFAALTSTVISEPPGLRRDCERMALPSPWCP